MVIFICRDREPNPNVDGYYIIFIIALPLNSDEICLCFKYGKFLFISLKKNKELSIEPTGIKNLQNLNY